jgi:hypothetical protein
MRHIHLNTRTHAELVFWISRIGKVTSQPFQRDAVHRNMDVKHTLLSIVLATLYSFKTGIGFLRGMQVDHQMDNIGAVQALGALNQKDQRP